MSSINLTHHFLIAMPNMADPYFAKTLTYICEHNDQGALGLVVNRPIDMTLQALFERLSLRLRDARARRCADLLRRPGADRPRLRAARARRATGSRRCACATSSASPRRRTSSRRWAAAKGRARMLVTLGYAGWSPGQLEHELSQNAWLTVEASDGIIFDTPAEERLPAAMELLGLDFARLQDEAGHA